MQSKLLQNAWQSIALYTLNRKRA